MKLKLVTNMDNSMSRVKAEGIRGLILSLRWTRAITIELDSILIVQEYKIRILKEDNKG